MATAQKQKKQKKEKSLLEQAFDRNRTYQKGRLAFVNALGIDDDFKEACLEMFEEVGASVGELMGVEGLIVEENKKICAKVDVLRKRKYAGM